MIQKIRTKIGKLERNKIFFPNKTDFNCVTLNDLKLPTN